MLKLRRLTRHHYREMPWKNHRGTTSEIFIFPETATVQEDSYLWRVSSAAIASSCSFSQFLGFDRTIVLLEGESMALNHDCVDTPQILKRLTPYRFKGEWQTSCEISDRAVQDLNLIVRRGKAMAHLQVLELGGDQVAHEMRDRHTLIFCVSGEIEMRSPLGQERLLPFESFVIENDENPKTLELRSIVQKSEVIVIGVNYPADY